MSSNHPFLYNATPSLNSSVYVAPRPPSASGPKSSFSHSSLYTPAPSVSARSVPSSTVSSSSPSPLPPSPPRSLSPPRSYAPSASHSRSNTITSMPPGSLSHSSSQRGGPAMQISVAVPPSKGHTNRSSMEHAYPPGKGNILAPLFLTSTVSPRKATNFDFRAPGVDGKLSEQHRFQSYLPPGITALPVMSCDRPPSRERSHRRAASGAAHTTHQQIHINQLQTQQHQHINTQNHSARPSTQVSMSNLYPSPLTLDQQVQLFSKQCAQPPLSGQSSAQRLSRTTPSLPPSTSLIPSTPAIPKARNPHFHRLGTGQQYSRGRMGSSLAAAGAGSLSAAPSRTASPYPLPWLPLHTVHHRLTHPSTLMPRLVATFPPGSELDIFQLADVFTYPPLLTCSAHEHECKQLPYILGVIDYLSQHIPSSFPPFPSTPALIDYLKRVAWEYVCPALLPSVSPSSSHDQLPPADQVPFDPAQACRDILAFLQSPACELFYEPHIGPSLTLPMIEYYAYTGIQQWTINANTLQVLYELNADNYKSATLDNLFFTLKLLDESQKTHDILSRLLSKYPTLQQVVDFLPTSSLFDSKVVVSSRELERLYLEGGGEMLMSHLREIQRDHITLHSMEELIDEVKLRHAQHERKLERDNQNQIQLKQVLYYLVELSPTTFSSHPVPQSTQAIQTQHCIDRLLVITSNNTHVLLDHLNSLNNSDFPITLSTLPSHSSSRPSSASSAAFPPVIQMLLSTVERLEDERIARVGSRPQSAVHAAANKHALQEEKQSEAEERETVRRRAESARRQQLANEERERRRKEEEERDRQRELFEKLQAEREAARAAQEQREVEEAAASEREAERERALEEERRQHERALEQERQKALEEEMARHAALEAELARQRQIEEEERRIKEKIELEKKQEEERRLEAENQKRKELHAEILAVLSSGPSLLSPSASLNSQSKASSRPSSAASSAPHSGAAAPLIMVLTQDDLDHLIDGSTAGQHVPFHIKQLQLQQHVYDSFLDMIAAVKAQHSAWIGFQQEILKQIQSPQCTLLSNQLEQKNLTIQDIDDLPFYMPNTSIFFDILLPLQVFSQLRFTFSSWEMLVRSVEYVNLLECMVLSLDERQRQQALIEQAQGGCLGPVSPRRARPTSHYKNLPIQQIHQLATDYILQHTDLSAQHSFAQVEFISAYFLCPSCHLLPPELISPTSLRSLFHAPYTSVLQMMIYLEQLNSNSKSYVYPSLETLFHDVQLKHESSTHNFQFVLDVFQKRSKGDMHFQQDTLNTLLPSFVNETLSSFQQQQFLYAIYNYSGCGEFTPLVLSILVQQQCTFDDVLLLIQNMLTMQKSKRDQFGENIDPVQLKSNGQATQLPAEKSAPLSPVRSLSAEPTAASELSPIQPPSSPLAQSATDLPSPTVRHQSTPLQRQPSSVRRMSSSRTSNDLPSYIVTTEQKELLLSLLSPDHGLITSQVPVKFDSSDFNKLFEAAGGVDMCLLALQTMVWHGKSFQSKSDLQDELRYLKDQAVEEKRVVSATLAANAGALNESQVHTFYVQCYAGIGSTDHFLLKALNSVATDEQTFEELAKQVRQTAQEERDEHKQLVIQACQVLFKHSLDVNEQEINQLLNSSMFKSPHSILHILHTLTTQSPPPAPFTSFAELRQEIRLRELNKQSEMEELERYLLDATHYQDLFGSFPPHRIGVSDLLILYDHSRAYSLTLSLLKPIHSKCRIGELDKFTSFSQLSDALQQEHQSMIAQRKDARFKILQFLTQSTLLSTDQHSQAAARVMITDADLDKLIDVNLSNLHFNQCHLTSSTNTSPHISPRRHSHHHHRRSSHELAPSFQLPPDLPPTQPVDILKYMNTELNVHYESFDDLVSAYLQLIDQCTSDYHTLKQHLLQHLTAHPYLVASLPAHMLSDFHVHQLYHLTVGGACMPGETKHSHTSLTEIQPLLNLLSLCCDHHSSFPDIPALAAHIRSQCYSNPPVEPSNTNPYSSAGAANFISPASPTSVLLHGTKPSPIIVTPQTPNMVPHDSISLVSPKTPLIRRHSFFRATSLRHRQGHFSEYPQVFCTFFISRPNMATPILHKMSHGYKNIFKINLSRLLRIAGGAQINGLMYEANSHHHSGKTLIDCINEILAPRNFNEEQSAAFKLHVSDPLLYPLSGALRSSALKLLVKSLHVQFGFSHFVVEDFPLSVADWHGWLNDGLPVCTSLLAVHLKANTNTALQAAAHHVDTNNQQIMQRWHAQNQRYDQEVSDLIPTISKTTTVQEIDCDSPEHQDVDAIYKQVQISLDSGIAQSSAGVNRVNDKIHEDEEPTALVLDEHHQSPTSINILAALQGQSSPVHVDENQSFAFTERGRVSEMLKVDEENGEETPAELTSPSKRRSTVITIRTQKRETPQSKVYMIDAHPLSPPAPLDDTLPLDANAEPAHPSFILSSPSSQTAAAADSESQRPAKLHMSLDSQDIHQALSSTVSFEPPQSPSVVISPDPVASAIATPDNRQSLNNDLLARIHRSRVSTPPQNSPALNLDSSTPEATPHRRGSRASNRRADGLSSRRGSATDADPNAHPLTLTPYSPILSAAPLPTTVELPPLVPETDIVLDISCENLDKMHLLLKACPFLEIYQCHRTDVELKKQSHAPRSKGNFYESVYRTETCKQNLNPKFKRFVIPVSELCQNEYDRPIMFRVWDQSRDISDHVMMGECQATLRELMQPLYQPYPYNSQAVKMRLIRPELKLVKKGYTDSGFIVITSIARFKKIDELPAPGQTSSTLFNSPGTASMKKKDKEKDKDKDKEKEKEKEKDKEKKKERKKHKSSNLSWRDDDNLKSGDDTETTVDEDEKADAKKHEKSKKSSKKKKKDKEKKEKDKDRHDDDESTPASPSTTMTTLNDVTLPGSPSPSPSSPHPFLPRYLAQLTLCAKNLPKSSWFSFSSSNPFITIFAKSSVVREWYDAIAKEQHELRRIGRRNSGLKETVGQQALYSRPPSRSPEPHEQPPIDSQNAEWLPVWTTEIKSPGTFQEFSTFLFDVSCCIGVSRDFDTPILVQCFASSSLDKVSKPEMIGSTQVSMREFLTGSTSAKFNETLKADQKLEIVKATNSKGVSRMNSMLNLTLGKDNASSMKSKLMSAAKMKKMLTRPDLPLYHPSHGEDVRAYVQVKTVILYEQIPGPQQVYQPVLTKFHQSPNNVDPASDEPILKYASIHHNVGPMFIGSVRSMSASNSRRNSLNDHAANAENPLALVKSQLAASEREQSISHRGSRKIH